MDENKIAESLTQHTLMQAWSPDNAADTLMAQVKKLARFYHLDRIYESSGKGSVHFDGWGGGYTIWFEQDDEGVYAQLNASGEANVAIDKVFYSYFDNMIFEDKKDLVETIDRAFNEVSDLLIDLYPSDDEE